MNSFDFLGFDRSEIEGLLKLNLHDNLSEYNLSLKKNLPAWIVPYISRDCLTLSEVAAFICGRNPNIANFADTQKEYEAYTKSLWDAVDSEKLSASDILLYDNPEYGRRDCTLVRSEVESWVKAYEFNWPLPLRPAALNEEKAHIQPYLDQWGEFPGKNTALMLIAGMAIALAKSSQAYKNGDNLNKSAIARAVSQNLASLGYGGNVVTEKQMTNLIKEALEITLPDSKE